jgi:lysophospholipase L1-like esterase
MNYLITHSKKLLLLVLVLALVTSCKDYQDLDVEPVDTGDADFSSYVAVGNSLTAGFQSNALYEDAQEYSFPNLLARQLQIENFEQPLISNPGIGDPGRIELTNLENSTTQYNTNQGQPINTGIGQPYNNLGVPGIKVGAYLNAPDDNPFYPLIVNEGNPQSPLPNIHAAVEALQPTVVSFWLGNNDILTYVTSGGLRQFTNPSNFRTQYVSAITQIQNLQSDPTVITANIPSVASIPFATTVGPQFQSQIQNNDQIPGLVVQKTFYQENQQIGASENRQPAGLIQKSDLDDPSLALILLTARDYLPYVGVSANPQAPSYNEDAVNTILNYWRGYIVNAGVATEEEVANYSQSDIEDTLTQMTIGQYQQTFNDGTTPTFAANYEGFNFDEPFGLSAQNPFPNQFALGENEINITNTVTGIFNSVIASQGDIQFDVNSFFDQIIQDGQYTDPNSNVTLQPTIGSLFSLDGIHPSNRAHAALTNELIETLNSATNGDIDKINVSKIPEGIPVAN